MYPRIKLYIIHVDTLYIRETTKTYRVYKLNFRKMLLCINCIARIILNKNILYNIFIVQ